MGDDAELRLFARAAVAQGETRGDVADLLSAAVGADPRVKTALRLLAPCPPLNRARVHVSTVLSDTWVPHLAGASVADLVEAWAGAHAVGLPRDTTDTLVAAALQRALLAGGLDALVAGGADAAVAAVTPLFAAAEAGVADEATLGAATAAALRASAAHFAATRPVAGAPTAEGLACVHGAPPRTAVEARWYLYFGHSDVDAALPPLVDAIGGDDGLTPSHCRRRLLVAVETAAMGGHLGTVCALAERNAALVGSCGCEVDVEGCAEVCVRGAALAAHADLLGWGNFRLTADAAIEAVARGLAHPDLSDTATRSVDALKRLRTARARVDPRGFQIDVPWNTSLSTYMYLRAQLQPPPQWPDGGTLRRMLKAREAKAHDVVALVRMFVSDQPLSLTRAELGNFMASTGRVEGLAELAALGSPPFTVDTALAAVECCESTNSDARATLTWLRGRSPPCPWDAAVFAAAAKYADTDVLAWMLAEGCPASPAAVAAAAARNRVDVLAMLRSAGVPWDATVCTAAAHGRALKALVWLCKQRPPAPWDEALLDPILQRACDYHTGMKTDLLDHLRELRGEA